MKLATRKSAWWRHVHKCSTRTFHWRKWKETRTTETCCSPSSVHRLVRADWSSHRLTVLQAQTRNRSWTWSCEIFAMCFGFEASGFASLMTQQLAKNWSIIFKMERSGMSAVIRNISVIKTIKILESICLVLSDWVHSTDSLLSVQHVNGCTVLRELPEPNTGALLITDAQQYDELPLLILQEYRKADQVRLLFASASSWSPI